FVQLHKEGLIDRDKRLVNWDPHFQTAISDLEVEQKEADGAYWHFAYPLAPDEHGKPVTYEHPDAFDDDGKATEWETRDFIVVADCPGRTKGPGAAKITPGHDCNDRGGGDRAGLEALNVMDALGRSTAADTPDVPAECEAMDRFTARKAIVARAEEEGWL